ncbi:MAG: hypothetical protein BGO90_10670 [Legionella sp. 40-6]|nr:hypothetical protein [Legionella sp.]OJY57623.1 MAG: hypothetical protein BGO90_10670 [Legionella sp. 40-6]
MGLWTTFVDSTKATVNIVRQSLSTVGSYLPTPLQKSAAFIANTVLVYGVGQVMALRHSIPALFSQNSRKTMQAASYILVQDTLPLLALNGINFHLQNFAQEYPEENYVAIPAAVLDWAVMLITLRQSTQLFMRTFNLSSMAPGAFAAHKEDKFIAPCDDCSFQQRSKASLRAPLLPLVSDLVTIGLNKVPGIGPALALVNDLATSGKYIVDLANVQRCGEHKETATELITAVGFNYSMMYRLMDNFLASTTGPAPYFVERTLRMLLILALVNNANHMNIPYVQLGKGTISKDPIMIYNRGINFALDTLFYGIFKQCQNLFKPRPDRPPLFIIKKLLQSLYFLFDADRPQKQELNLSQRIGYYSKIIALPRSLHSTVDFKRDRVTELFLGEIISTMSQIFSILNDVQAKVTDKTSFMRTISEKLSKVRFLKKIPKDDALAAQYLYYQYGIPLQLGAILWKIAHVKEFPGAITAGEGWLKRLEYSADKHKEGEDLQRSTLKEPYFPANPEKTETPPNTNKENIQPRTAAEAYIAPKSLSGARRFTQNHRFFPAAPQSSHSPTSASSFTTKYNPSS